MSPNEKLKPLLDNAQYAEQSRKSDTSAIIFSVLITAIVFSALSFFWQNFNQKNKNTEISQLSAQVATLSSQLAVLQDKELVDTSIKDNQNNDNDQNISDQAENDAVYVPGGAKSEGVYLEPVNLIPELKGSFAYKYGINANDVSVAILESTATHTRGTVVIDGGKSRTFLAARGNGSYTIVHDGNGAIMCSVVAPYNFPAYMISDCVQ